MREYLEKFIQWTKVKIRLHLVENDLYFYEREIWWTSLGVNVGYEQDGKHEQFERPVLVLKKFNRHVLWILPMTTKTKNNKYYYSFEHQGQKYSIILTQLRLISSKRLLRKIRKFPKEEFEIVKEKIKEFL